MVVSVGTMMIDHQIWGYPILGQTTGHIHPHVGMAVSQNVTAGLGPRITAEQSSSEFWCRAIRICIGLYTYYYYHINYTLYIYIYIYIILFILVTLMYTKYTLYNLHKYPSSIFVRPKG